MLGIRAVVRSLALVVLLTGCSGIGKLTNDKAQAALDKWSGTDSKVVVQSVQEIPQENVARVNINFDKLQFKSELSGQQQYSGPGIAIFNHYNDGRWVLTRVETSQGLGSNWWNNLNIEAK